MLLKLYQVDAFASSAFTGNPAAVCPLDRWLPDDIMQKIADENNLSETAFFVKNENGFHIRWFTPTVEVELCGHATLASAFVIFHYLDYQEQEIQFQSRSGILTVQKEGDWLCLNFPTDELQSVMAPEAIWKGLGIVPDECYKGKSDYLAVFETEKIVAGFNPNFSALAELNGRGLIVTAPGDEVDFISRGFFPAAGVDEDPATGSAHTTLTPYWANRLNKTHLDAWQISKRKGIFKCVHLGDRVEIKGQAVPYLIGEIDIPWDVN